MSEIRNENQLTWVVTAAALVASNLAWIAGEMK